MWLVKVKNVNPSQRNILVLHKTSSAVYCNFGSQQTCRLIYLSVGSRTKLQVSHFLWLFGVFYGIVILMRAENCCTPKILYFSESAWVLRVLLQVVSLKSMVAVDYSISSAHGVFSMSCSHFASPFMEDTQIEWKNQFFSWQEMSGVFEAEVIVPLVSVGFVWVWVVSHSDRCCALRHNILFGILSENKLQGNQWLGQWMKYFYW